MRRLQWFGCYLAFRLYLAIPLARDIKSRLARLQLWLLQYAGAYAHSPDFEFFCENARFGRKGRELARMDKMRKISDNFGAGAITRYGNDRYGSDH